jgi:hypothetical protein
VTSPPLLQLPANPAPATSRLNRRRRDGKSGTNMDHLLRTVAAMFRVTLPVLDIGKSGQKPDMKPRGRAGGHKKNAPGVSPRRFLKLI